MCYEEIEGMTLFVCRDVYMLYKIGRKLGWIVSHKDRQHEC